MALIDEHLIVNTPETSTDSNYIERVGCLAVSHHPDKSFTTLLGPEELPQDRIVLLMKRGLSTLIIGNPVDGFEPVRHLPSDTLDPESHRLEPRPSMIERAQDYEQWDWLYRRGVEEDMDRMNQAGIKPLNNSYGITDRGVLVPSGRLGMSFKPLIYIESPDYLSSGSKIVRRQTMAQLSEFYDYEFELH